MQRSLASMEGMPVATAQGLRMGEIRDAWLETSEHRLLAYEVAWSDDQALNRDEPLPLGDVVELTADVATVADEIGATRGQDLDFPAGGEGLFRALGTICGMAVLDARGVRIGTIADVHFDPQDGTVRSYEVSTADDPDAPVDVMLLAPHRALEWRDGRALVVPAQAEAALRAKPTPRLDVTLMDELELDEPQGDEDVEVSRAHPAAEA